MSLIFDIKRYAINDGPGIRITLFMKGCPLSCIWCHNPEGIRNGKDKLYTAKKCLGCGTCLKACPNGALTLAPEGIITDKQKCVLCGRCAEECPAMAIEISGTEYTAEYLMHEIEKEKMCIRDSPYSVHPSDNHTPYYSHPVHFDSLADYDSYLFHSLY